MFTASGLVVRFLKVFEPSGYNSVKWVRYLTKASGSYQIRVCGALYLNYYFWTATNFEHIGSFDFLLFVLPISHCEGRTPFMNTL
jgi:hypothetical protein